MAPAYEYQWKVTIEFWNEFIAHCRSAASSTSLSREFRARWFGLLRPCSSCVSYRPDARHQPRPSHMMVLGADPIAAARALKGLHLPRSRQGCRIERGLADTDGLPRVLVLFTESADRVWNYVAVGCSRTGSGGRNSSLLCHMTGYDGDVSLEMEGPDHTTVDAGFNTSIDALRQTISQ